MILRRFIASILVLMFIVLSLPNFLIYGISRTYLNPDFYRKDSLIQGIYDFTVDKTVGILEKDSDFITKYFRDGELRPQIEKVFTKKIFADTLADFAGQIEAYKKDPSRPIILSLRDLRANLLTVGNNLAYVIYQDLPSCSDSDLARENNLEMPTCVPEKVPYEEVVKPITDSFENTIYNEIPEELSNIDQAVPLKMMVKIESYRNYSFLILVLLLALIVMTIYGRISTILSYISSAFFLGGVVGYGFSYALNSALASVQGNLADARSQQFLRFMLDFLVAEVQRMSILFMVVGLALFLIRFVIRRTMEDQKSLKIS
jgi:hypothetical protein